MAVGSRCSWQQTTCCQKVATMLFCNLANTFTSRSECLKHHHHNNQTKCSRISAIPMIPRRFAIVQERHSDGRNTQPLVDLKLHIIQFSKALVPKNRNKAGKTIMRAHRIFNTLFNLSNTDLANSGHTGSSKPGFNCLAALANLKGGATHKTHTQHLSHTHLAKSQGYSQPVPHHGCRRWVRAALLHKQVDIMHILLNGQTLASTTCMAATKHDSNVD